MAKKVKLLSPTELFEQVVSDLQGKARRVLSDTNFQMGWGGSFEVGDVNEAVLARVNAYLASENVEGKLDERDGKRRLILSKIEPTAEERNLSLCRQEVLDELAASAFNRKGDPVKVEIDSHIPAETVLTVVQELRTSGWTVEIAADAPSTILISAAAA